MKNNFYYDFLDQQINDALRSDIGFNNLIAASPFRFKESEKNLFLKKYKEIKKFQTISLELFLKSLQNKIDPFVKNLVLNELPAYIGETHHLQLPYEMNQTPVFFRTDEVIPGKISEIQSPGSAWGLYEQIFHFYNEFKEFSSDKNLFTTSLSKKFFKGLNEYIKTNLGLEPIVHHLLDNASIPHGMRFFIQQTRKQGLKYFGYDKGIISYDCNFIRAHAFLGLISDNFKAFRLKKYQEGELLYDLFPSILFDQKISLIFPFHKLTRNFYSDEIRELFPFSSLITPEKIYLEDDMELTPDEFASLPQSKRKYFLKYAGSDLGINWGSKGVFYLGGLSRIKCREILNKILQGFNQKKYWMIQKAYFTKDNNMEYIDINTNIIKDKAYAKFSGFYGPSGLMGILVMHRTFPKVHGSPETILSIA